MNNRIQELAEQAKKYALDAMIKITDKEQALKVYSESYDTKFAELIVRECMDIAINAASDTNFITGISEADKRALSIAVEIRNHFGVNE